jgi:hypothetical protein
VEDWKRERKVRIESLADLFHSPLSFIRSSLGILDDFEATAIYSTSSPIHPCRLYFHSFETANTSPSISSFNVSPPFSLPGFDNTKGKYRFRSALDPVRAIRRRRRSQSSFAFENTESNASHRSGGATGARGGRDFSIYDTKEVAGYVRTECREGKGFSFTTFRPRSSIS